jgi:sucrose-6-phosphate hydrolase SacC (GH32 family)
MAESRDGGGTWTHAGVAEIAYGDPERDTYWAPDVVWDGARWHMYVTFVPGRPRDWNEVRRIVHLTSADLVNWGEAREVKLASDRVIDASVCRLPDGTWGMWYNNERDRKSIYWARSRDLGTWEGVGKVVGDRAGEGPKVFAWRGKHWMVVDHWNGIGVYSSDDAVKWERQEAMLLDVPGKGEDDGVVGNHCDVVVRGERAWMFYFTHPGRRGADAKEDGPGQRRSSIQVVELEIKDGKMVCDRDGEIRVALGEGE